MDRLDYFPRIDYQRHPAFSALDVPDRTDDVFVRAQVAKIDAAIQGLGENPHLARAELKNRFQASVVPLTVELRDYLVQTTENERVANHITRSFADVGPILWDGVCIANKRSDRAPQSAPGRAILDDLQRFGCHATRVPAERMAKLRALCATDIERLRSEAKTNTKGRLTHNYELYSAVGQTLAKYFKDAGILDGLAGYAGSNVNFIGFSLEYSCARQSWWKGLYADAGVGATHTSYMHYDYGCRDPKAIIALSEVTEECGPTAFVKGSHKAGRSPFLHAFAMSLDSKFVNNPDLPGEQSYFRSRFSRPEYRREFLMLPKAFQITSHFGEDILDDDPQSARLVGDEVRLTKDTGDCIVFDGNHGIHRGGLVKSGERIVFQVIFDIADPLPGHKRVAGIARQTLITAKHNLGL